MRRRSKLLAVILAAVMLSALIPFTGVAYGTADKKLIVTHIDSSGGEEGSGIIFTPNSGDTMGSKGSFAWWKLVIFEWSEADSCYKVTKVMPNSNNSDKSSTEIPENGFVYAVNTGNNYPDLYASTGNEAFNNKPNYQTPGVLSCFDYAGSITVGTKAYVYKADLKNSTISTNGTDWYKEGFVSETYIKMETPDSTGTPYDPNDVEEVLFKQTIDLTHINTNTYANGMSIIFTKSYGNDIHSPSPSGRGFQWWKTATFEWSASQGAYVVTSLSRVLDNNSAKHPVIPENGFVIAAITGGTLSDAASAAIGNIKVGQKAYLYGVDPGAGTMSSGAKVTVNFPEEGKTSHAPAGTQLATPVITTMTGARTTTDDKGFKIEWNSVPGAESYTVNVIKSLYVPDGELAVKNVKVTGTSYQIGEGVLEVGSSYVVSVFASAAGKITSVMTRAKLSVISEEALSSNLRTKTIVAFGDSLTARTGWVNLLGGRFGAEVINSGVGGDNTNQARARFSSQVLANDPDIVIINFGMNDQAKYLPTGKTLLDINIYTANLDYFAKTLIDEGVYVLFVTPNNVCTETGYYTPGGYSLDYSTDNIKAFSSAMRSVAAKYGCDLVDINYETEFDDLSAFVLPGDGLHQSAYGHQRYAELIGNQLAAKFDSKNTATLDVEYVDENGVEVAEPRTFTGAVGARINIPVPAVEGYTPVSAPAYVFAAVAGDIKITFTQDEAAQLELKEDTDFVIRDGKLYITDGLKPADVLAQIQNAGATITLTSGQYVGTGSKITVKSGDSVLFETEIVLLGDANGDGGVNSVDYLAVKRHFLGSYTLTGSFLIAGNVDGKGKVDSFDYLAIKRHFIGSYDIYADFN